MIRAVMAALLLLALSLPVDSAHPVQTMSGELEIVPMKGLLAPSGLNADELQRGLRADLRDLAGAFAAAERETGVSAAWLGAIAALESGWGCSDLAREKNNLFGWTGSGGYRAFESAEECILTVARALRTDYLSEGGRYHHGYEIEDVAACYCPNPAWASTVRGIHAEIVGRCAA